jgi:hypothetical protein
VRRHLALAVLWLLAACGPATATSSPTSGVEGQVTLGPMCPVLNLESPCPDRPYATRLDVMDHTQQRIIVTINTDQDGRFRQPLPPGDFVLVPAGGSNGGLPRANPTPFHLAPDEWLTLDVSYDSGIR